MNSANMAAIGQPIDLEVHVQFAIIETKPEAKEIPSATQLCTWVSNVWRHHGLITNPQNTTRKVETTVRIVERQEIQNLNKVFRGKDTPTNVLSFPFYEESAHKQLQHILLGDIVVCAPVVHSEAEQKKIALHHHYAHMVTHGMLHLLKYDHQENEQAKIMEHKERKLLANLGIANPYQATSINEQ